AHGFGGGMPRRLVTACAPVFASPAAGEPTGEDISAALDRSRFYLRHNVDADGTTLYRLFHQALGDHLRRARARAAPPRSAGDRGDRAISAAAPASDRHGAARRLRPRLG